MCVCVRACVRAHVCVHLCHSFSMDYIPLTILSCQTLVDQVYLACETDCSATPFFSPTHQNMEKVTWLARQTSPMFALPVTAFLSHLCSKSGSRHIICITYQ